MISGKFFSIFQGVSTAFSTKNILFVVVFSAGINFLRAINLFNQNQSHNLMRKNQFRKAPNKIRSLAKLLRHAKSSTNHNHKILRIHKSVRKHFGELWARNIFTTLIQQNHKIARFNFCQNPLSFFFARFFFSKIRMRQNIPAQIKRFFEPFLEKLNSIQNPLFVLFANRDGCYHTPHFNIF